MHENFEGDQNNYNICGDDVDLVREIEIRSSINVVNENDDVVSGFDAYNSSGDNVYDIFDDDDKIITKDSIFWVNTNIIIWEGRVIKIIYSDLPQYSNDLKIIWIQTKKGRQGFD